jgi:DNA modification methylase
MVFTDPPYGISYDSVSHRFDAIRGDSLEYGELVNRLLVPVFRNLVDAARDEAAFYVWHSSATRREFETALELSGLQERQYLIWGKPHFSIGRQDYQNAVEPCFYASKVDHAPAWHGDRKQTTYWRISAKSARGDRAAALGAGLVMIGPDGEQLFLSRKIPRNRRLPKIRLRDGQAVSLRGDAVNSDLWEVARDGHADHPTQKPIELALTAIQNSAAPGGLVLDSFLGSGSTLLAAESCGRVCYGLEMEPKYCALILERAAESFPTLPIATEP